MYGTRAMFAALSLMALANLVSCAEPDSHFQRLGSEKKEVYISIFPDQAEVYGSIGVSDLSCQGFQRFQSALGTVMTRTRVLGEAEFLVDCLWDNGGMDVQLPWETSGLDRARCVTMTGPLETANTELVCLLQARGGWSDSLSVYVYYESRRL